MITINLLPWREEARTAKKALVVRIALGFIFMVLCFVFSFRMYLTVLIKHQQARNDDLKSKIKTERSHVTALTLQKNQVKKIESKLHFIISLQKTNYQAVKLLDTLPRVIPAAVALTKLTRKKNDITLFGDSRSNIHTTSLMEHIAKTQFFKQHVSVEVSENNPVDTVGQYFQLKLQTRE